MNSNYRPDTTVILAMTADGKIADYKRSPARFGSLQDKTHLEEQVALVDAVLFGAGTLRAYGTTLSITNPQLLQQRQQQHLSAQPLQIVVSASGKLNSQLRFFSQPVPRWLITTAKGAKLWQERQKFEQILIADLIQLNPWQTILKQLKELGINRLAILGGGELVASLLTENLIDQLWLTVCPVIFGGRDAPTPVEGEGFLATQATKLQLVSVKQIEQEVFLHYLVKRSPGN
ncbi:bifunctional deaminase-reductase-like protein [Stanieria sp. NIES-3757]|nr:bifunctional deaminase-reductase-like protein [Stanieria sp. NIES-3757]